MNIKLEELTALEIGTLVNERKISPLQVVDYFLDRIEKYNKSVNSFVYVKADYARSKAFEMEKRLCDGKYLGPFAGVPFALKDFLPNKPGWQSSHGGVKCLVSEDNCYSVFCQAMEKAGGIAIGKTNAPAYGFRGTTDNRMYGVTSTPYNLKYNAGGSSGGSAAAVAAGLVPIAEGGDAGGSIRIPASFCNLFGYKAGVGVIPSVCRPDAWSATHPLCFNGGLTKSVQDSAVLLDFMASFNNRDPFSRPKKINFSKEVNKPLKKLKIAYTEDFGIFEVEEEIRQNLRMAAQKFRALGFTVDEVQFNFKHSAMELSDQWCKGITIDCALELNHLKTQGIDYLKNNKEDFPEEFIYWKEIVDNLNIEDMYKFNLARTDVLDEFENIFEKYDLILSPVSCVLSILNASDRNTKGPESINGKSVDPLIGWTQTFLANFAGNPSASIPSGILKDNIPCGVQLTGRRFEDEVVLKASRMFEEKFPWKDNFHLVKL